MMMSALPPPTGGTVADLGNPEVAHLAAMVLRQRNAEKPTAHGDVRPPSQATAPAASQEATLDKHADQFLKMAVAQDVSDIHLRCGFAPVLRKDGDMVYTQMAPITKEQVYAFMERFSPPNITPQLRGSMDLDFSFEIPGLARFRVNWLHELDRPAVVLRIIKTKIPDFQDLGLPNVMLKFAELNKGLVLITGPTGSGKTTTLASLLNHINKTQRCHVITLEDPVEFVYSSQRAVFTQRQLKSDTASFPDGIKYALRQDPDIILVGEMRDRETIEAALHAAETGHLVFSTLHTNDAVQTIGRIINQFQPHERESIREQLAGILMGTVSQRLVKRANGKGRVPINEIMVVTSTIRDYILKNEIDGIYELMSSGFSDEAISLNHSLYKAFSNNEINYEDALEASENKQEFMLMVRGMFAKHDEVAEY